MLGLNLVSYRTLLPRRPKAHPATRTDFFIPASLDDATRQTYQQAMSQLLVHHHALLADLTSYCRKNSPTTEPSTIIQSCLPVASFSVPLKQRQTILQGLLGQPVSKQDTTFKELAKHFPRYHSGDTPAIQLTSWAPRKEFDLLPDMLYTYSSLPYKVVVTEIEAWPYDRKLTAFETYIGAHGQLHPSVLAKTHYSWDILAPTQLLLQLRQQLEAGIFNFQDLTPRHGYDMPTIIEDADLSDRFEACFDLSLKLYSQLQQAGFEAEAQYATLQGHKQRCHLSITASQVQQIFTQLDNTEINPLITLLQKTVAEKHPVLVEEFSKSKVQYKKLEEGD